MLKQPMIEKLLAMRLHGMAESLKMQEQDPAARESQAPHQRLCRRDRLPRRTRPGQERDPCALAQKACRDGYSALYTRAQSLFRDLAMARADGSLRSLLARLSRIDVLVIDDWTMASLSEPERRDFWEICEDRYQVRSTILTSQLPVSRWHEQIGDPTLADRNLDRLGHHAAPLQ